MITRIKQPVFKAEDGSIFLDFQQAFEYEAGMNLWVLMDRESVGRGGEWSPAMIYRFIWDNRDKLINIFNPQLPGVEDGQE